MVGILDFGVFTMIFNKLGPSGLFCQDAQLKPMDANYPCRSRADDIDGDGVADADDSCPMDWNPLDDPPVGGVQMDVCTE